VPARIGFEQLRYRHMTNAITAAHLGLKGAMGA